MRSYCLGVSLFFLLNAGIVQASVSISEVAWMGSAASANYEWIELYNNGEALSIDGWILSDGQNLNINLTGTIGANNYAVLERTSDDSVTGTAFLIYTGALVNTGTTLTLQDSSGGIIDQVAGGENWQNIGGDNVSKETAQYTPSGWVTDGSTPGAANGTGRISPPPSSSTTTSPVVNSSGRSSSAKKAESVNLKNPETKLTLKIEAQSVGYINQVIPFYVTASGLDEITQRTVSYEWNFGDSYPESGRRVVHRYSYPGEYLVTVFGHKNKNEQTESHKIIILPVNFSLSVSATGDVQIHNDSTYDVDISNYVLKGAREVVFPARSVVMAKATVTVASSRLRVTSQDLVMLYDSSKNLVASTIPKLSDAREVVLPLAAVVQKTPLFVPLPTPPVGNFHLSVDEPEAEVISDDPVQDVLIEAPTTSTTNSNNVRWPYLALIGLILVTYLAVFFGRQSDSGNRK